MMTILSSIPAVAKQALCWAAAAGTTLMLGEATVLAENAVSSLMQQRLADVAGKIVTVLTVDYAPGAASEPHIHPGSVVAYVLEGAVVSQLEGGEPITYTRGQTWYESPRRPHVVSKNASKTQPAKILAFLLSEEGEPIKTPMP